MQIAGLRASKVVTIKSDWRLLTRTRYQVDGIDCRAVECDPASAKRVTCFRSLRGMAEGLLVPESCVRGLRKRVCEREYKSDNGKT